MAFYSAKDAEQSVKLIPSGWLGALPRRATKTNRLISVISFYGKNERWGSIPRLEAGRRITRYLLLLVFNSVKSEQGAWTGLLIRG